MKPSVTFFGERLPKSMFSYIQKDVPKCDLVLVVGTSLKVGGSVLEILREVGHSVPQILINRDEVLLPKEISTGFDVTLLGLCDDVSRYLCQRLGWIDSVPQDSAQSSSQPEPGVKSSEKVSLENLMRPIRGPKATEVTTDGDVKSVIACGTKRSRSFDCDDFERNYVKSQRSSSYGQLQCSQHANRVYLVNT